MEDDSRKGKGLLSILSEVLQVTQVMQGLDISKWELFLKEEEPTRWPVEESAYSRRVRVTLLPRNFWFRARVLEIRGALGIPAEGISPCGSLNTSVIAGCWQEIHKHKARGLSAEPKRMHLLPAWVREYVASPHCLAYSPSDIPAWLQVTPRLPESDTLRTRTPVRRTWAAGGSQDEPGRIVAKLTRDYAYDEGVPLDRFAMRLIEVFNLPLGIFPNVRRYIMVNDEGLLHYDDPFDVTMEEVSRCSKEEFRIVAEGIDVFSSRKQWDEVWVRHIEPRLLREWKHKFGQVNSRPAKRPAWAFEEYLELYALVRQRGHSVDKALEHFVQHQGREAPDRRNLFRVFSILDTLMMPQQ